MNDLTPLLDQLLSTTLDLMKDGENVVTRAKQDAIDGFGPGTSMSSIHKARGVSDPTSSIAIRLITKGDPIITNSNEMIRLVRDALKNAQQARDRMLRGMPSLAPELARESSIRICEACEATIAQVGENRIKAGYCPACYRAWLDAQRPDRSQFQLLRSARKAS